MSNEQYKTSHEKVMRQWADDIIYDITLLKATFGNPGEILSGADKKEFVSRLEEVEGQLKQWGFMSLKNIKKTDDSNSKKGLDFYA